MRLVRELTEQLGTAATVSVDQGPGGSTITVTPTNPASLRMDWEIGTDFVTVEAGQLGGDWEWRTEHGSEDADNFEDAVRSIVAGRVREAFGPNRSRVTITLSDGNEMSETGIDGCLAALVPRRGWLKTARVVQYEPYLGKTEAD